MTSSHHGPYDQGYTRATKIAITRFDQRIRVGGMAEIVGFNKTLLQPRRETLEMVVRDLFPRGGHVEQATFWTACGR